MFPKQTGGSCREWRKNPRGAQYVTPQKHVPIVQSFIPTNHQDAKAQTVEKSLGLVSSVVWIHFGSRSCRLGCGV